MAITDKIAEIEAEMARTQKNKNTEYHLGQLKAKLAKYRAQLLEPDKKSKSGGVGFDVPKAGYARVALIGFPSVGKSTLLSKTTPTQSAMAAYEYTTLTAIPGVLDIDGAKVQLLDLPGIIEGASSGRGRGRQVVSTARTSDLVIIMLDAMKSDEHRALLESELEAVGIRLNQKPPDVQFRPKASGGVLMNTTVPLTHLDDRMVKAILQSYKVHNAHVSIHEDITVDQFVDVVLGNRNYVPCLYCYNKCDAVSLEEVDRLARLPHSVVVSCERDWNLDVLKSRIWEAIGYNKLYTRRRGEKPDWEDPIVVKHGATVEVVCRAIHKNLPNVFRFAVIYGKSSKFSPYPQKVGLSHVVADDDVITIYRDPV